MWLLMKSMFLKFKRVKGRVRSVTESLIAAPLEAERIWLKDRVYPCPKMVKYPALFEKQLDDVSEMALSILEIIRSPENIAVVPSGLESVV